MQVALLDRELKLKPGQKRPNGYWGKAAKATFTLLNRDGSDLGHQYSLCIRQRERGVLEEGDFTPVIDKEIIRLITTERGITYTEIGRRLKKLPASVQRRVAYKLIAFLPKDTPILQEVEEEEEEDEEAEEE